MKNLYETLNVAPDASEAEIKMAYRKQAQKHHPDKNGGSDEQFQQIKLAHDVLIDADRRQQYDQTGDTSQTSIQQAATSRLAELFSLHLNVYISNDRVSMLDTIKIKLQHETTKLKTEIEQLEKIEKQLLNKINNITRRIGHNLYQTVAETALKDIRATVSATKTQLEIIDEIKDQLEHYEEEIEPEPQIVHYAEFAWSNHASNPTA